MLMRHKNIKIIPEFNIEIIRRGAELKSWRRFCALDLRVIGQMAGYILHFGCLSFICFRKNETFMCSHLSFT